MESEGKHKIKKPQRLPGPAQITVARRESSGIHSAEVWEIYLNGESLGSMEDFASVTVVAGERENVLMAKDAKGDFTRPYKFSARSGARYEVCFDGGKFRKPHRIDSPAGGSERSAEATEGVKLKIRRWFYWAVLAGYCTGVFFLCREIFLAAHLLPLIPVLVTSLAVRSIHRDMVNYLYDYHPEEWGGIARDMDAHALWRPNGLLSFDEAVEDPVYEEMRKEYRSALWAIRFSGVAYVATIIYSDISVFGN